MPTYNLQNIDLSKYGLVKDSDINRDGDIYNAKMPTSVKDIKENNPALYKASSYIAQHPALAKTVGGLTKALGYAGKASEAITKSVEGARIPEMAGGLLQSAADVTKSVGDIPFQLTGSEYRIKAPHFERGARKDPMSQAVFGAARGAGQVIPFISGMGELEEAARLSPELLKFSRGATGTIGRGALTGAAMGEEDPLGRAGGAIGGAAVGALEGITPSGAISKILKEKSIQENIHKSAYKSLEKEAESVPYNPIKGEINKALLKKMKGSKSFIESFDTSENLRESIPTYSKNPSYKTAHTFQSDLGKAIRSAEKSDSLTSIQSRALKNAESLQKELKNSITSSFRNKGRGDLATKYNDISESYAKNVVPYDIKPLKQAAISKGFYGRIGAKDALEGIRKVPHYEEALSGLHGKAVSKSLPSAAKAAVALLGTYGGLELARALGQSNIANKLSGVGK